MQSLLLEPYTSQQVNQFLDNPANALLLVAPEGMGKSRVAYYIFAQLLKIPETKIADYAYFVHVKPTNNRISIDDVRHVQHALQLKTLGGGQVIKRAVLIEQAHYLTTEAQNALLKLLEEPPKDTIIILTTPNLQSLLPTITSRTQHIFLKPPLPNDIQNFFTLTYKPADIERAHRLSEGLPGLMVALLEQSQEHPLVQAIENAKQLLRKPLFERLAEVDELTKQKSELGPLLGALQRVAQAALLQAAERQQLSTLKRWERTLQAVYYAQRAFEQNAQTKLLLTNLMVRL